MLNLRGDSCFGSQQELCRHHAFKLSPRCYCCCPSPPPSDSHLCYQDLHECMDYKPSCRRVASLALSVRLRGIPPFIEASHVFFYIPCVFPGIFHILIYSGRFPHIPHVSFSYSPHISPPYSPDILSYSPCFPATFRPSRHIPSRVVPLYSLIFFLFFQISPVFPSYSPVFPPCPPIFFHIPPCVFIDIPVICFHIPSTFLHIPFAFPSYSSHILYIPQYSFHIPVCSPIFLSYSPHTPTHIPSYSRTFPFISSRVPLYSFRVSHVFLSHF